MTKTKKRDRGARGCGARHGLDRGERRRRSAWRARRRLRGGSTAARSSSAAASTSATASTVTATSATAYGYAYNTCWKYTPYGLVNVCKVLPY